MSITLKQALIKHSNDYSLLEDKYAQITNTSLSLEPFAPPAKVKSAKSLTVSIVLPAWNVKDSILACLNAIEKSSFNLNHQNRLQVIVVDDGSTDGTWEIIKKSRFSLNLTAIRENHHGQAQALNTGISIAEGNVVISCDADMVLCYHTIEHFIARHQLLPNVLLTGFRHHVNKNNPKVNLKYIQQHGTPHKTYFTGDERIVFPIAGYPNNMCLASWHFKRLGNCLVLWMPDEDTWYLPDLVFGSLFSLPKSVYINLGGYDERFQGWGCTDSFLATKAIAAGCYIVPVYAASGLHINHPPRSGKTQQLEYEKNRALFFRLLKTLKVGNYPNWLAHAKSRIVESFTMKPARKYLGLNQKKSGEQENGNTINIADSLLSIGKFYQTLSLLKKHQIRNNEWSFRLSKALFGLGRYQEAIETLRETSVSTNFSSKLTIELAITLAASGQFVSAREILKKLSQTQPQTPELDYWYRRPTQKHISQGCNYLKQKFYDTALRCFEVALIVEPNNKTALNYRDTCLSKLSSLNLQNGHLRLLS